MADMDEARLAAELQAVKDEQGEWEDPEPAVVRRAEKRRLAAMISVRLAPDELALVQAHARDRGETVSGYLRNLALRDQQASHFSSSLSDRVVVQFPRTEVSVTATTTSKFISSTVATAL